MTARDFAPRLAQALAKVGPVCAGIDPHPALLSAWGLDDDGPGLERFGLTMVEAAQGVAAAVKPQAALFERRGLPGMVALASVLRAAREADLLAILDVKRGDIGSTMAAYAEAYLGPRDAGQDAEDVLDFVADAITVSPFLGFESLAPAIDRATQCGRGIFVLALTSNPSGREVQHALRPDGRSVAAAICDAAAEHNRGRHPMGPVGLVVGATVERGVAEAGLNLDNLNGPILAPGFGSQGAGAAEIRAVFGAARGRVVVPSSRGLSVHGPDPTRVRAAIVRMRAELTG
ncbi:MAG: orotidine-5'-phosphate decarboxylase [Bifidobacteriaceae bacterium]|jgi:orotidine-5'-phosphate decarboxylase|nr:orotidine-5'-phosphate decarboxylase [Bifidobacteriaceae bacterium]